MTSDPPVTRPSAPYFTVVVLPDTQKYVQNRPGLFEQQTRWIVEKREQENIEFVVHEGDVVQQAAHVYYQRANGAMEPLDRARVPYLISIGNHDYDDVSERDSEMFRSYFPRSRFVERSWWGGSHDETGVNAFATFEALGGKYLVLALELFPRRGVLDWATGVLSAHSDHVALMVTHAYLYRDATPIDTEDNWDRTTYDLVGTNGDELWSSFVSRQENLSVVCCGHVLCDGSAWRTTAGQNGNPIHQILTNYQTLDDGGRGYLRLLRFFPTVGTITVETYSPLLGEYHPHQDHCFRIDDAF